jgi:hypothetical protein
MGDGLIPYGQKLEVDQAYVWAARWPDNATVPGDEAIMTALRFSDGDDVAMVGIENREGRTVYGSFTPKVKATSANVYMPLYLLGATAQVLKKATWGSGLALKINAWLQGSTASDPTPQIRGDVFPGGKYIWLAYWGGAIPGHAAIVRALKEAGAAGASVLRTTDNVAMGTLTPLAQTDHQVFRDALSSVGAMFVKLHSNDDFPFPDWALDAGEKLSDIEIPDVSKAVEWGKLALIGAGVYLVAKVSEK